MSTLRFFHRIPHRLLCVFALISSSLPAEPPLAITADLEGRLRPCPSCPSSLPGGGMAHRAALLRQLRDENPGLLFFDAGNALNGVDALGDQGRSAALALARLQPAAVNIATADFRYGPAALLEAVHAAELPAISANLRTADTGDLLFPASLSVADNYQVIGLTEAPAALEFLPHLRQQLEGIEVTPPGEALRQSAAQLPEADRIVVLYHGGTAGLRQLLPELEALGDRLLLVVAAGLDGPPPVTDRVPLLVPAREGRAVLTYDPARGETHSHPVRMDLPEDPGMQAFLSERGLDPVPSDPPAVRPTARPAGRLAEDSPDFQRQSAENRGFLMTVHGLQKADTYQEITAPPGTRLLILDTQIENNLAFDLVLDHGYPEAVLTGALSRQLYLVVNGREVHRMLRPDPPFAGTFPERFTLPESGVARRGDIVFPLPDSEILSLSLRFYHDEFPPLVLPLWGEETESPFEGPHARSENQMTAALHAFEELDTYLGTPAPEGMVWVRLDLRGRSLRAGEIDAVAEKEEADPNAKIPHGRVAEYLRADDLIQLVADGRDAYTRNKSFPGMPETPAFLPDITAGGTLIFPAPRGAASLHLLLDFPELRGAPGATQPDPMLLTLREGDVPPLETLARIDDDPLPLTLLAARWHENPTALEIEVEIRNISDTGGMYQADRRARLQLPNGDTLRVSETRLRGGQPTPEEMWLPAGGAPRRFSFFFTPPEAVEHAVFNYSGVSSGGNVPLRFEAGIARASEAQPTTDHQAPDTAAETVAETADVDAGAPAPLRPPPEHPFTSLPDDPEAEPLTDPIALNVSAQNQRLELSVTRAYLFDTVHGRELDEGQTLVGVHLQIKRRDDTDAGRDQHFVLRNWRDWLYAVDAGGWLRSPENIRNDSLSIADGFRMQRTGQPEEGLLYFEVPTANLGKLELIWMDPEYGHMTLPIFPVGEPRLPDAEPLHAAQNQLASLEVHGHWKPRHFRDRQPARDEWRVINLRGRSLHETAPGQHGPRPLLPRDWSTRILLVLDGRTFFHLDARNTTLPDDWVFTPLRHTGGNIAFDLPEGAWDQAETAELLIGFGPHTVATGPLRVPDLLRIPLKGNPARPAEPQEILGRQSDMDLEALVLAYETPETIPGSRNTNTWAALHLQLTARRPEGVILSPDHRFDLLSPSGSAYRLQSQTWGDDAAENRNAPGRWLPPGVPVRLKLVWHVPEAEQSNLRFLHAGVMVYDLLPVGAQAGDGPPAHNPNVSEKGTVLWEKDREARGLEGVDLTPAQVNSAIDRGRDYLWQEVQDSYIRQGRLSGRRVLIIALYALVNVEAHLEYPEFDEHLRAYLHQVNPNDLSVYEVGLLAMILRAYGSSELHEKLEQVTRWLVESQGENGTWHYSANVPDHFFPQPEIAGAAEDGPFLIEGGGPPPDTDDSERQEHMYRTISFRRGAEGDNSTTQFAVLGLWSVQRAGISVDADVWERTLMSATRFQSMNRNDALGGYSYRGMAGRPTGAMTSAGLSSTAISMRHLDPDIDVARHPRILNALGWLADNFSVSQQPNRNSYHYYHLYSLERVGQILGTEFMGEHEWYPLGARHLVDTQEAAGSWPTGSGETNAALTTSYALLFLIRATPAMDEEIVPEPEPEGPGTLVTTIARAPAPPRVYLILDASGSMRAPLDGQNKFDRARDAVRELIASLPEGIEVALRVYGHRRNALHEEANLDSALELPFHPVDPERMNATLDRLRPVGRTPLTYSLTEALGDIGGGRRETLVLLLTDGGDDTRTNPVEAASAYAELERVNLHILGFDINRPNWTRQLTQMAEASNGWYHPVAEAANLARDLKAMVTPPPPAFQIETPDGQQVAEGRFGGEALVLEPGEYLLRSELPGKNLETRFWVHPGRDTRVHFDWQAAVNP